jgi:hypothetical protein
MFLTLCLLGYVFALVLLFTGAGRLPKLRGLLLTLGTLGLIAPVLGVAYLLLAMATSNIHMG